MVLPASSVAHAPRQGVEPWIQEILAGLHLSPAGVLILVDGANPEVLGRFVRTIIVDFPDAGLLSQGLLQHFLANVWPPAWMETGMRSKLETELAKTLHAQGRHAEADAIKPDLVKLDTL